MHRRSDNDETRAGMAERNAPARSTPGGNGASLSVPPDAPVLETASLFGDRRQVVIGHNSCRYVLRITRHGKLILNK
jgi:hemin uptake protein HemP